MSTHLRVEHAREPEAGTSPMQVDLLLSWLQSRAVVHPYREQEPWFLLAWSIEDLPCLGLLLSIARSFGGDHRSEWNECVHLPNPFGQDLAWFDSRLEDVVHTPQQYPAGSMRR